MKLLPNAKITQWTGSCDSLLKILSKTVLSFNKKFYGFEEYCGYLSSMAPQTGLSNGLRSDQFSDLFFNTTSKQLWFIHFWFIFDVWAGAPFCWKTKLDMVSMLDSRWLVDDQFYSFVIHYFFYIFLGISFLLLVVRVLTYLPLLFGSDKASYEIVVGDLFCRKNCSIMFLRKTVLWSRAAPQHVDPLLHW